MAHFYKKSYWNSEFKEAANSRLKSRECAARFFNTMEISIWMFPVFYIYIFYRKFTTDHTVNSLFVAMVDFYN